MIKQAIAGVSPPSLRETTIMVVWPSIAATGIGQTLGRLYSLGTLGKLIALASIPIVLPIFFWMLLPWVGRRYRLTNRRLIVERALPLKEVESVSLDDFDAVDVRVEPGQAWYPAGNLIFRKGAMQTMRLDGVPRPEAFRQVCLKAQRAHAGVKQVLETVGS